MRELRLPHNAKLKQGRDNSVHMLLKPEISHEWFITRYQILKLTITYLGLALWEWLLLSPRIASYNIVTSDSAVTRLCDWI